MTISYDDIAEAFLSKIAEFELFELDDISRERIVDGYMKRAIPKFNEVCTYDLSGDDQEGELIADFEPEDVDEILDIISEGMVTQWLKPFVNRQESLEGVLNTRDFTTYSPAEMLLRVGNAYRQACKDYVQMVREYSFAHGDLTNLHL